MHSSASDDKAGVMAILTAVDALKANQAQFTSKYQILL